MIVKQVWTKNSEDKLQVKERSSVEKYIGNSGHRTNDSREFALLRGPRSRCSLPLRDYNYVAISLGTEYPIKYPPNAIPQSKNGYTIMRSIPPTPSPNPLGTTIEITRAASEITPRTTDMYFIGAPSTLKP